jgi:hypothetical protein
MVVRNPNGYWGESLNYRGFNAIVIVLLKAPSFHGRDIFYAFNSLQYTPLPFPNRAIKPPAETAGQAAMADGTAPKCGRVGSCHILLKVPSFTGRDFFMPGTLGVHNLRFRTEKKPPLASRYCGPYNQTALLSAL